MPKLIEKNNFVGVFWALMSKQLADINITHDHV